MIAAQHSAKTLPIIANADRILIERQTRDRGYLACLFCLFLNGSQASNAGSKLRPPYIIKKT